MPAHKPIYATRLTPARQPNTTRQICHRCGIDYHPHNNHPTHCRDCRGYLKKGG